MNYAGCKIGFKELKNAATDRKGWRNITSLN